MRGLLGRAGGARAGLLLSVAALAILLLVPARAAASVTQESILQDDNQLIYSSPQHSKHVLETIAALGVDRVRLTIVWAAIAPDPFSTRRPRFDATNPDAYPAGVWYHYDLLVQWAQELGIGVDFNVTAPAPYWAASSRAPVAWARKIYSPSGGEYGAFVTALGRRYSGRFVPRDGSSVATGGSSSVTTPVPPTGGTPGVTTPVPPTSLPPTPGGGATLSGSSSDQSAQQAPLPRVNYWSIWNEPDEAGWLTPQWRSLGHGRFVPAAPVIYRRLVDAGWRALQATGHGKDTILIGETAAKGAAVGHGLGFSLRPMPFLRALYCVDSSYRPLSGGAAAVLSCPGKPDPRAFSVAHPGLFEASGWAHHPYSFHAPPQLPTPDPNSATLADLPRLERGLDRIFKTYGRSIPGGLPLYLTEYGYKSRPPNPFADFSQQQQATFINQGEYMGYSDPRVRAFAQFLLVDDRPNARAATGSRSYWGTFQTGLIGLDGKQKPAYTAFRIPMWLPSARHGSRVTVWGQLRPALRNTLQYAVLEYRSRGSRDFRALRAIQTFNPRAFVLAHVSIPGPGWLRLAWQNPTSKVVYRSRAAQIN